MGRAILFSKGYGQAHRRPRGKILMEELPLLHSPNKITFTAASFILYESSEHRYY